MKICSWRFVLWRFVRDIFPFEDLFMEICPLKICSGDFSSFSFLQEKQDLISSQLIFITHELPLFDLCIWWLRYVWTYSCKSLTQKKFIVYPMKLCGAKVWNYLTGFDVGYLTWMRHSWMPLIYKLKHDFENLDFWGNFFILFYFFKGWGMAECP